MKKGIMKQNTAENNTNNGKKQALTTIGICILLLGVLAICMMYSVTVGSADLTIKEVYEILLFKLLGIGDPAKLSSGAVHDIVWFIRFPKIVLAVAVGMGLAVVGCVMQAVVKNPLADPYILGISSGASLGATIAVLLGIGTFGSNTVGVFAFAGALAVSFGVISLSHVGGRSNTVKLILAGVALSSLCSAASNFIVYIVDEPERFMTVTFWLMGSLASAKWASNAIIMLVVLSGTVFFVSQSRVLNLMLLGEDTALTLGTDIRLYRIMYLIVCSLMVGFIVYTSGVIGFVGLIIPHFVRGLVGADHKRLIPISALTGSIFVVVADIFARSLLKGGTIPIGILISVVGAPTFIYLLVKKTYSFGGNDK